MTHFNLAFSGFLFELCKYSFVLASRLGMLLELAGKTNNGVEWNQNVRKSIAALLAGCLTGGWKAPG